MDRLDNFFGVKSTPGPYAYKLRFFVLRRGAQLLGQIEFSIPSPEDEVRQRLHVRIALFCWASRIRPGNNCLHTSWRSGKKRPRVVRRCLQRSHQSQVRSGAGYSNRIWELWIGAELTARCAGGIDERQLWGTHKSGNPGRWLKEYSGEAPKANAEALWTHPGLFIAKKEDDI